MSLKGDLQKYKPRKEQQEALSFIDSEWQKNKLNKFFLLNLPTGVGKSYLALMIADWYRKNVNRTARVDIITNSKILQEQYTQSFESISDLKGKNNYECQSYSCSCAQGSEFNRLNKTSCESCPYTQARDGYMSGGISLTNFYLYILYAIYNPKLMEVRGAKVLIVDECHAFDDIISDFISIKITESIVKKFKFSNEYEIIKNLKSVSSISQYVDFLKFFNSEIISTIEDMEKGMSGTSRTIKSDKRDLKISKVLKTKNSDVRIMNLISDLKQYQLKIDVFLKEYKLNASNWILESNWNDKSKQKELSLEPIWAYDYLDKYVFSNYDMVFLMSGTILDKNLFCQLNGLDVNSSAYYSIPSPFPIKNRPVYYMPLGKMSYAKKEETFQNYIPFIKKLLLKYKNKKGIIHTNSFELANWIQKSIKDPRLIFHDSSNKDEMLKMHYESEEPTVLVSPSMSTGVSFDNDAARFQIICKVPYPSLASQKNKMRMSNNPDWYSWLSCCELLQMVGRSVRSDIDYADTIIVDGSFGDMMKYSSNFLPKWFQDSIKRINVKTSIGG
jgi:ATP-dependent DNA helicase DinG